MLKKARNPALPAGNIRCEDMMQDRTTYTALALAGTLPFIACALLALVGVESIPYLGAVHDVAASYGLAIVCFVAGTHWGLYLSGRATGTLNLFILSNVLFLVVWFAYIGASTNAAIAFQVLVFVALLVIDRRLAKDAVLSARYLRIRAIATLIAVVALLIVLAR